MCTKWQGISNHMSRPLTSLITLAKPLGIHNYHIHNLPRQSKFSPKWWWNFGKLAENTLTIAKYCYSNVVCNFSIQNGNKIRAWYQDTRKHRKIQRIIISVYALTHSRNTPYSSWYGPNYRKNKHPPEQESRMWNIVPNNQPVCSPSKRLHSYCNVKEDTIKKKKQVWIKVICRIHKYFLCVDNTSSI